MNRLALIAAAVLFGPSLLAQDAPRDVEFRKLIPFAVEACGVVRENPAIFPYRSFTFGPFGLETRKASSPEEADSFRNLYLGAVGGSCGLAAEQLTAFFFCGPECPRNRREHFVRQLKDVRAVADEFETLAGLRLVAVWAPRGELRVNDVFLMAGQAREAIPSPTMGFVPSGEWKPWPSLNAYLKTLGIAEDAVRGLTQHLLAVGFSAVLRENSGIRLVGVGVGDNESGIVLTRRATPAPEVGRSLSDNKTYSIVERLAPDVYYYETN